MVRPISEHLKSRLNRQCRRCSDNFLNELPLAWNLYTQLDSNCWTVAKAQTREHTDNGAFVNAASVPAICS
jgi:hypothetical protein